MTYLGMNVVDLSVAAILLVSGALALIRGLVRELVVLGVWIGSVVASAMLYPLVKPWMSHYIKSEMGADAASALALFCITLIILIPIGHLVSSLIRGETLTAIDRSLGFVFGLVRGILVVSLLYLGAAWMWPKEDGMPLWLKDAKTRPAMSYGATLIRDLVPQDELAKAKADMEKGRASLQSTQENLDTLNRLAMPVPAPKPDQAPAYNENARGDLGRLMNEKSKP